MRKIKFRAWDLDKKEMVYPPSEISSYLGPMMTWRGHCYIEGVYQNLDFQQFTGLIDKNGKDIYEGDIIRIEETAIPSNDVQKKIRGADIVQSVFVGSVGWCNESASYDLLDTNGECIIGFPRHEQTYEVIGNIYENPSLLAHPHDK